MYIYFFKKKLPKTENKIYKNQKISTNYNNIQYIMYNKIYVK